MTMPQLKLLNDEPSLFETPIKPAPVAAAKAASTGAVRKASPALPDAALPRNKVEKSATAHRTISEVAEELNVPQHVLRFWETKFTQLRPLKRAGGRRYYRIEDVALIRQIYSLLYAQGYTIKGAQKVLKEKSSPPVEKPVQAVPPAPSPRLTPQAPAKGESFKELSEMLAELKALRELV